MTTLGLVTIGQSPRKDLLPELKKFISDGVKIKEKGAMDGVDKKEIENFSPENEGDTLVTRMRDGSQVILGKKSILPRMQKKIDELNREKVDLIALLCSGKFPNFDSGAPLIFPERLVRGLLSSISISGKLGLLVPSQQQKEEIAEDKRKIGFETVTIGISPYENKAEEIALAAMKTKKKGADLILLDCFGYDEEMKDLVFKETKIPTILVRSLLGRAISELV